MIIVLGRVEINRGERANDRVHTWGIMESSTCDQTNNDQRRKESLNKTQRRHKSNYAIDIFITTKIIAHVDFFIVDNNWKTLEMIRE